MMGEVYYVGYGGGMPCTEVRAHTVFVTRDRAGSSLLRSSSNLTFSERFGIKVEGKRIVVDV